MMDEFREEGLRLAAELQANQLRTKAGHPTWLIPSGYGTPGHPFRQVQPTGHLYDGSTGIALFLAAASHIGGEDRFRELSLAVIAPLRTLFRAWVEEDRAAHPSIQVGGLMGVGSFIYAFQKISDWLGEPDLLREAQQLTLVLTPERLAQDRQVRIQTGSAGTLLALLALHRRNPEPNADGETPLDIAGRCVDHLLGSQVPCADFQGAAWPLSPGKPPLAGYSYGAAGICYALTCYAKAVDSGARGDAARAGAAAGWEFVRSLYAVNRRSWRDPRRIFQSHYRLREGIWKDWWASGRPEQLERRTSPDAVEESFLDIWCHGAAGVALAALVAPMGPEDAEQARQVLERLSTEIGELPDHEEDDICCGAMGRVEVLQRASQIHGQEDVVGGREWQHAAQRLAAQVLERARVRERYTLTSARGRAVFAPSFFQGLAGVGYTFLRLAAPENLPSVLLLE